METTICPERLAADHGLTSIGLAGAGMESMSVTLPYSGGMLDQPAVLMDGLNLWLAERASLKPPPKGK